MTGLWLGSWGLASARPGMGRDDGFDIGVVGEAEDAKTKNLDGASEPNGCSNNNSDDDDGRDQ